MLGMCEAKHTAEEKVAALGSMTVTIRWSMSRNWKLMALAVLGALKARE
jgi:hypothetical protein